MSTAMLLLYDTNYLNVAYDELLEKCELVNTDQHWTWP